MRARSKPTDAREASDSVAARRAAEVELVRALLAGEAGSWERLVEDYGGIILAVVRRTFGARRVRAEMSEVDDVVENTFVALLRDDCKLLRDYNPEYALSTWLGVVARTQCHRLLRTRSPLVGLPDEMADLLEDSDAIGAAERLSQRETVELVRRAIGELSDREQAILRAFYYERRDYKEIGKTLGISVNSVGAALTRARNAFKQRFERMVGGSVSEHG